MKRLGIAAGLFAALAFSGVAVAGGSPGTVSVTIIDQAATHVGSIVNPCTGHTVAVSVAGRSVEHITYFTNSDEFWYTFTATANATFTDGAVTYSGHDTFWVGANGNERNSNFTLTDNGTLLGSDGSRVSVHERAHMAVNAVGIVTVWFDVIDATCR
jgi:hypothetical protein